MKKATGIGGIFFKVKDPAKTRDWYTKHLGLNNDDYGSSFEWRQADEGTEPGFTVWSPFKETSDYFDAPYMINFRVENLDALVETLKSDGVEIAGEMMSHEYGKFIHIIDGDGQKVELWEAVDDEYSKMIGDVRTK